MDYKDHLERLKTEAVVSAQKAVDFADGYQKQWMTRLLDTEGAGIKRWRERGVQPLWENFFGLVVDRSAQSYAEQPIRTISIGDSENEDASAKYTELLYESKNFTTTCEYADALSRYLKTAIVMPTWVQEIGKFVFSTLSRHNCDVDYDMRTGEIKSLIYTDGGVGPKGGQQYWFWTPDKVMGIEENNGSISSIGNATSNPYGIVPIACLNDTKPPRFGFWHKPVWEQMTLINEALNMFHIETKFNVRWAGLGQLFTDMQIPDGTVFGGDTIVEVTSQAGQTPYFEYKIPQLQVEPIMAWCESLRSTVAEQWGVNLRVAGSGSADSGFKLVVEEFPNLELRKKRINAAKRFEKDLYDVMLVMSDTHNLGLQEGSLYVDFQEPSLPVDHAQEWLITKEKIAMGYMAVEDAWLKDDPDLSPEDIEARKLKINGGQTLPDFGGAVDGEQ